MDSSANRNIESAVTPIAEVAGKVALCRAILDLGRTGGVVSGCEASGQAEVRRCDEFIAPKSLCLMCNSSLQGSRSMQGIDGILQMQGGPSCEPTEQMTL